MHSRKVTPRWRPPIPDASFEAETENGTFTLRLVDAGEAYDHYYNRVANRLLWFTLHELWSDPYRPSGLNWAEPFDDYLAVNDMIAEAVIAEATDDDGNPVECEIHLQDYHLLTAAPTIRKALPDAKILLYIHTPWVHPTYLRRLPDRMITAIIGGIGACDLVGISAPEWAQNLRDCLTMLGEGVADFDRIRTPDGSTLVRDFTLGIDRAGLLKVQESEATAAERQDLRDQIGDRQLIVRADRTDLSKNILRGLHAFDLMLDTHPEMAEQVHFRMLLNLSRQSVPEYQEYLERCMDETQRIRDKWGEEVVLADTDQNFPRVVASMSEYDVLFTNPVIDGTNLVAKEGPAMNETDGVLILSRFAGAATVMGEAILINPFDVNQQAQALYEALTMDAGERARRAAALKKSADLGAPREWLSAQVEALAEAIDY